MQSERKRHCQQCLLRKMDVDGYLKNFYRYIDRIGPDEKASDFLYKERLEIGKSCERLLNGMCKACGCFVELRAVIEHNVCPYDL
ncbi:MAG: DUF6171 family protein [Candidatus Fimimorpha sp.]